LWWKRRKNQEAEYKEILYNDSEWDARAEPLAEPLFMKHATHKKMSSYEMK
jgi:hypothetical protein